MQATTRDAYVKELTAHVMAAELNLTFFASRHGRESLEYKQCLKDFATAWYLLRKQRNQEEFLKEVLS